MTLTVVRSSVRYLLVVSDVVQVFLLGQTQVEEALPLTLNVVPVRLLIKKKHLNVPTAEG